MQQHGKLQDNEFTDWQVAMTNISHISMHHSKLECSLAEKVAWSNNQSLNKWRAKTEARAVHKTDRGITEISMCTSNQNY